MPTTQAISPVFATTRWSLVFAASRGTRTGATNALEALCSRYWYPLYAFVRRSGYKPQDAQDLTQEFFARLIQKEWLAAADPERGRFRSFLLVAMKRVLAKEWHRERAQKRGGGNEVLSFELLEAEQRLAAEPAIAPDAIFERRWALTLIEDALGRLEQEYAAVGKQKEFETLSPWLTAARGEIPYSELGSQLAASDGAARVAVHRLRKRFRELFRTAVSATLQDDENVDDELRHLASALSGAV